jgi:type IV pilus assembly protein PilC
VPIVKSLDITASIIENRVYKQLLKRVSEKVQLGKSLSKALYEETVVPNILIQMVHIGEETGELGYILKNLATFYRRELDTAIDSVIGLIEPAMIVSLGLGVGVLVDAERSELLDAFTAGQLAGKFQEHHLDLRSIVVADKVRAPKKPPTEGEWKPGDIIG